MHQSKIFFMEEPDKVNPIPQPRYVSLVRGEQPMPEYANKTIRLADWYMEQGSATVENETYSLLTFDGDGFVDWPNCRHGIAMNHAFYQEIAESAYEDIDDDPTIQKLREELGTDFTWYPSRRERAAIHQLAVQEKG